MYKKIYKVKDLREALNNNKEFFVDDKNGNKKKVKKDYSEDDLFKLSLGIGIFGVNLFIEKNE